MMETTLVHVARLFCLYMSDKTQKYMYEKD